MPHFDYDFAEALKRTGALWQAPPLISINERSVHAELTSGRHSDGFINFSMMLTSPRDVAEACDQLTRKSIAQFGNSLANPLNAEYVIGSAIGGITICHEIARSLGARCAFTEKSGDRMKLQRFIVPRGARVLVVEDVMTTGGTSIKTTQEMCEVGCEVTPLILSLVNRRNIEMLDVAGVSTFVSSLELDVTFNDWAPEECPHCARGSTALLPKKDKNWARFMGY